MNRIDLLTAFRKPGKTWLTANLGLANFFGYPALKTKKKTLSIEVDKIIKHGF